MRLKTLLETSNLDSTEQIIRYVSIIKDQIYQIVNGKIEFDLNIWSSTVDVTFTAANTEVAVSHGLGRVPTGYILVKSSAATALYDGTTTNTASTIYLKASVAATVKIIVF